MWRREGYFLVLACSLAGCVPAGYAQSAPTYKPLCRDRISSGDGRSARPEVEGTVARGHLRIDEARYTGKVGDETDSGRVSLSHHPRRDVLRGQERFNIYCSPCHSRIRRRQRRNGGPAWIPAGGLLPHR